MIAILSLRPRTRIIDKGVGRASIDDAVLMAIEIRQKVIERLVLTLLGNHKYHRWWLTHR